MERAKRVFLWAGVYGVVAITPLLFLEPVFASLVPPEMTHPAFFYGFLGVALAWQFVFFLIAQDPGRYRPIMPIAVLEKLSVAVAFVVLVLAGRESWLLVGAGVVDGVFAVLFLRAYLATGPRQLAHRAAVAAG